MLIWVLVFVFFVVINLINLISVKLYGEMEFWFLIIKVVVIVGMIGFGGWLFVSGYVGLEVIVWNLW